MDVLRFIGKYMKKYKRKLLIGFLLSIIISLVSSVGPYIMKLIVDVAIPQKKVNYIVLLSIATIIVYFVCSIGNFFLSYIFTFLSEKINLDIKKEIYNKLMYYPLSFYAGKEKGYILARTNEISAVKPLFSSTTCKLGLNIIEFTIASFFLFSINVNFTLCVYLFLPIYFFLIKIMMKKTKETIGKNMEEVATANGTIQQILSGIEQVKISNKENAESQRINNLNEKISKLSIKQGVLLNFTSESIMLICNIISVLVLLISAIYISKDTMTMGDYFAFSGYLPKLLAPVQTLASSLIVIQPGIASLKRLVHYFSESVEEESNLPKLDISNGEIIFDKLSFKYNEDEKVVINNLSLKIKGKSKVLIKGKNGSGKTTLLKLVMGLYSDYKGRIYIDGKDIKKYQKASIRDQISIVSQNVFLFSGTVKENIIYSVNDFTDYDLVEALNDSGLSEAFKTNLLNLESNVGENGMLLSGGQRQMIAIARAILKKSKILIFDEATSNLDSIKTNKLYELVHKKFNDSTCIIVSHDIIDEIQFDQIINLDKENRDEKTNDNAI